MKTDWQYSCIDALTTGTEAFKIFKARQVNRKLLDQYICRIWPYKYKDRKAAANIKENRSEYREVVAEIRDILLNNMSPSERGNRMMMKEPRSINAREFAKWIKLNSKNVTEAPIETGPPAFEITAIDQYGRMHSRIYKGMSIGQRDIMERLLILCSDCGTGSMTINSIKFSEYIDRDALVKAKNYCVNALNQLIRSKENSKKGLIYDSVNIGIEIEYNGCNCQSLEERLRQLHAVDFNSGFDGGVFDGSSSYSTVLRENRLRIKGAKGMKALEELLNYMRENSCQIDENSGLHVHIDCRDITRRKGALSSLEELRQSVKRSVHELSDEMQRTVAGIFRISDSSLRSYELSFILAEKIKTQADFKTLEWRMLSPTLLYDKMFVQILAAIHLTECAKYKNKKPNEKYLTILGELARKQDNQYLPVRQY